MAIDTLHPNYPHNGLEDAHERAIKRNLPEIEELIRMAEDLESGINRDFGRAAGDPDLETDTEIHGLANRLRREFGIRHNSALK